jgi:glyoxylase-like metal-dependent hydrolase (beta-lactamase superfamily II)
MIIRTYTGAPIDTHGYLVADEASGEAWAIDAPLDTAAPLLNDARELGLRVTRLVLTHGHFDHLMDTPRYQEAGIPVAAHPLEQVVFDAPQAAVYNLPYAIPSVSIDQPLEEGARLRLGSSEWEVWHVPGHSPGHLLLYSPAEQTIFGGDLVFRGSCGRVDLPGCDPKAMVRNLSRLLDLPPETRIFAGHGPMTTLSAEQSWIRRLVACPEMLR